MRWLDFPVEIAVIEGKPTARVVGAVGGGEMAAAEAEPVEIPANLDPLLRRLERRKASRDQVFALGRMLGDALLPGRVRELFERSRSTLDDGDGLRIRLTVGSVGLAALPWEYAHVARTAGDPQEPDFLALSPDVSLVRHQVTGAPLTALREKTSLRVVVAIAEPDDMDPLDLTRDRAAIEAALRLVDGGTSAVRVDVVAPATRKALAAALPGADVFHFAGHGGFGQVGFTDLGVPRTAGQVFLEQASGAADPLTGAELATIVNGAGVRLVMLGACQSATRDEHGPWSGVAGALVRNNVPAVVAMQFTVVDTNAGRFMAPFYASVLAGDTVDEAVQAGRREIFAGAGVTERDWGVPVLYSRSPDGVLFPAPEEPAAAATSPVITVRQRIREVIGTVRGIYVEHGALAGSAEVDVEVDRVVAGGLVEGVRFGGGAAPRPRTRTTTEEHDDDV
jgi:hypothetical protein